MLDLATLAQTACDAAGGGVLLVLSPTAPDERRWRATVAGSHGHREVLMDLALGTVEVHTRRRRGGRHRGSPGCRMPGCPPRSRRPA